MDTASTKILIQALILSQLDYGNSPLVALPQYEMDKLLQIQNMKCHIVTKLHKSDHISIYLKSLHWLKYELVTHKTAVLMPRCLNGITPFYFSDDVKNRAGGKWTVCCPTPENIQFSL